MALDPNVRRFLDRLAVSAPRDEASLSIQQRREALEQLLGFAAERQTVTAVDERSIPGPGGELDARIYTPGTEDGELLPGLVYFHGGGLVAGSLDSHDAICRSLANATGCRVVSVDYRLAPEAPFPAAVEDACGATGWVVDHAEDLGIDPRRVGVAGDSAGATLAAVACQHLSAQAPRSLAVQLLLCPILDYAAEAPSRTAFAHGYLVDRGMVERDMAHYLAQRVAAADPRVSPLRAQRIAGLPPTCIHTAEFDPMRDEGEAYAHRLRAAGCRTIYRCHSGMIHLFYGMGTLIPYVHTAYRQIAEDIRAVLAADVAGE